MNYWAVTAIQLMYNVSFVFHGSFALHLGEKFIYLDKRIQTDFSAVNVRDKANKPVAQAFNKR